MKITLAKNGWTPIITDIDLNTATKEEINIIGCLAGYQTLVVIKNQNHMTAQDDIGFIKKIGNPDINADYVKQVVIDNTERILRRVTGKKDAKGKTTGLFGFKEDLTWHANPVEDPNRRPLVFLRSIHGSKGSITSFTNHVRAWDQSFDPEFKKYLASTTLHTIHGHDQSSTYGKETMELLYNGQSNRKSLHKLGEIPPLVYSNKFGATGFFLSWNQLEKFYELSVEESKSIADKIKIAVMKDQNNFYDHHWEDGDVLLSDQWLGLHRRHPFEEIENRLLHRAVVDYANIDETAIDHALSLISEDKFFQ